MSNDNIPQDTINYLAKHNITDHPQDIVVRGIKHGWVVPEGGKIPYHWAVIYGKDPESKPKDK